MKILDATLNWMIWSCLDDFSHYIYIYIYIYKRDTIYATSHIDIYYTFIYTSNTHGNSTFYKFFLFWYINLQRN